MSDRRDRKREHMRRKRSDPEYRSAERAAARAAYAGGGRVRGWHPWTSDEDATIARMVASGTPYDRIASALPNRTVSATRARACRLAAIGAVDREAGKRAAYAARAADRHSDIRDDEIVRRAAAGESVGEIARAMGLPHRTVAHRRAVLRRQGRIQTKRAVAGVQGAHVDTEPVVDGPDFVERLREAGKRHGYRSDLR